MTASTTDLRAPDPGAGWVPVDACTLPTAEQPLRVAEFDDLFAAALREVQRPVAGAARARLLLAGDATLPGRVRRLADAETSCCAFFTFTVTELGPAASGAAGEARVALDIEVPAVRADVLDALVERAATQVPA
jgi:hypothetical protein